MILSLEANFYFFLLAESPPGDCKKLPSNNGLLMFNAVQLCLAANNILLMRKGNRDRSCVKMADRFASQGYSLKKQTRWSNDKTIIKLGYRKISWLVCGEQINYLSQDWSARHRQITIFCSTSSNIVNYLLKNEPKSSLNYLRKSIENYFSSYLFIFSFCFLYVFARWKSW